MSQLEENVSSTISADQDIRRRDGVSQAGRLQVALDPDYVSVDERTTQDLLAFAREYAKELYYFDVEDGRLKATGDWSDFLGSELNLSEMVSYLENPEDFSNEQALPYTRPHVVLFLTFLQLLRHAQDQLNEMTRRHLDFYYQQVLQMRKRPGTPDQVHVLAELASRVDQMLLPAGSLLDAGSDSQGQALFYGTDRDIVVNQAQVARQSTIYTDKRIAGIREAREAYPGPKDEAILEMLKITFGRPGPGDSLPSYPTQGTEGSEIDYAFLRTLLELLDFTHGELAMEFADLRELVKLKNHWEVSDDPDAEWQEINDLLQKAGRHKRNDDPDYQLTIHNSRDFDANLSQALEGAPDFGGVTEVQDLYDLYDQRTRDSVKRFIRGIEPYVETGLYFDDIDDFVHMMQIKIRLENEWAEINRILAEAGRQKRNDPGYQLAPQELHDEPDPFAANLLAALDPDYTTLPDNFTAVVDLDAYDKALQQLQDFFFMYAEDFATLMTVAEKWVQEGEDFPDPTQQEWDHVYALLEKAYRDRVYADFSKARLQEVREAEGFAALLDYLMGDEGAPATEEPLSYLQAYVRSNTEFEYLERINDRDESEVSAEEWGEVYRILQLAQRARLGDPLPQKEEWLNLYPQADATQVTVELDVGDESDFPRWKTFGRVPSVTGQDDLSPLNLGWAISSPMLALSQGQRTITLTLGFQREPFTEQDDITALLQGDDNPFQVEVSTEKGWVQPQVQQISPGDYHALSGKPPDEYGSMAGIQFVLTFAEDVDPLAALPATEGEISAPWPMLRLRLRQVWQPANGPGSEGRIISHYQPFKELVLYRTYVQAQVSGLLPAQLQNDEATLDPNKPFEPFGFSPATGSRLYLGHPEIITKKLDRLDFRFQWMGLPEQGFEAHYQNYAVETGSNGTASNGIKDDSFNVRVSLVDRRVEKELAATAPLFAKDDPASNIIEIPETSATGETSEALYDRASEVVMSDELPAWNRYLLWELNAPDFQHSAYPTVAVQNSVKLAAAIAADPPTLGDGASFQVNPPYTPKMKGLQLDYSASQEILVEAYRPGKDMDRLFHIHPFGYSEYQSGAQTFQQRFLPQYDFEGELYIGIREVRPPQNLSLLFQMAEGSADPDLEPFPVTWSYLSGNCWLNLEEGNVLQDTTSGLINSGIILFDLPPVEANTLLDPDLYWIRAAIPRHSNSVCDTVAIHTQAISATFVDQNNAPDHLCRPLPADSIAGLAGSIPEFAGFQQSYTSFGGRMAEQDSGFYTRISERLRHKQRALTIWDYERLVLERFPQLYKVKCLPADLERPGQIEIIVIPDIRNKQPFDPFQPKASAGLLAGVKTYLEDKIPPFATIEVKNAHYVPVMVRFGVRFRPGCSEGYYRQQLNEDINRFLSPWAYEEGAEIVIGGRIYANVIVNFIEEREYVDYVAGIKLFKNEDGRTFRLVPQSPLAAGYWVDSERPDGVLVAARQHEIDMIPEAGYEAEAFTGIEYMKIELDFIVA